MIVGYARVSTKGQAREGNGLEVQREALLKANAEKIYEESYTGTKKNRPELDKMLSNLSVGDVVIVMKLDRIARNVHDGIEIIDEIISKGCSIQILNMGTFDDSATGKLMRNVLLAFAEFERDMIVSRTSEGKAIAREREGYREGRPKKEMPMWNEMYSAFKRGEKTAVECYTELGCSKSTFFKRIREIA